MVQTGALLGPLVWLVSPKVELYEDAGGFILLAPCKHLVTALSLPTDWPAIEAWKAPIAPA